MAQPETVQMMAVSADPAFDVATIKPSDPDDTGNGFQLRGRRVHIKNETMNNMISFAYGIHIKQLVGGPEWFGTDRYDVDGVADVEGAPNLKQMQGMVKKLLADRFKLTFHRERRELSVYAITVGKSGPKLTKSLGDPNGLIDQTGGQQGGQRTERLTNNSMADFALLMQSFVDRPVVDQTGLAGRFDFKLVWTPNDSLASEPNAAPGLFTAMQEQLGLKLEPVKAPAEVLVIDHVERPSAN
jgi:uncharacterized protein (TIGR03435 family)